MRHLVLIDDKPSSFEGAPAEVTKLLVAGRFSSGADTHNVTLINDMYDALAFIK